MKVVKVHGGRVFHVVHETRTHARKAHAFILCNDDMYDVVEMRDGVSTCAKCTELDNPLFLSEREFDVIRQLAFGHAIPKVVHGIYMKKLIQRDFIDGDYKLTRRGHVLARDFTDGPAPLWDTLDIAHARLPLAAGARCAAVGPGFATLGTLTFSVEKYDRLRKRGDAITCLTCLGQL